MNLTIILIITFAVIFMLILLMSKRTKEVKIAYAGSADSKPTVKAVPTNRNKTIFTAEGNKVNLSDHDTFIIMGDSLAKAGIPSNTYVYTLSPDKRRLEDIMGKFVIFRYDVARQAKEHPDMNVTNDSYKARKALFLIPCRLSEEKFREEFLPVLVNDPEIENKELTLENLYAKYRFASDFYTDDNQLIVSTTYKDGNEKAYSFHSARFLVGVVDYRSV